MNDCFGWGAVASMAKACGRTLGVLLLGIATLWLLAMSVVVFGVTNPF